MSDELQPCPFCGQPAKLEELGDHHGEYFNLGCPDRECPGHHAYYTSSADEMQDAITAWNRRAPAEPAVQEPSWWHHVDNSGRDVFASMPFGLPDEMALYAAPVPAMPPDALLRSRVADLLHLIEFYPNISNGDEREARRAIADIKRILAAAPQSPVPQDVGDVELAKIEGLVLSTHQKEYLRSTQSRIVWMHGAWHVKRGDVWLTVGYDKPQDAIDAAIAAQDAGKGEAR